MAASDLTVTGTLTDALGTAYDFARTKMWVTFNTENGRVTDDEGVIRLDAGTATVSSDGSFSLAGIPCPGASNPISFQVKIHFDAPPRLPGPRDVKRFVGDFGWMTITEDATLQSLEDEQSIPPNYQTTFTDAMDAILDESQANLDAQIVISGIDDSDSAVAGLIEDQLVGPLTNAALATSIDDRTRRGVRYAHLGDSLSTTVSGGATAHWAWLTPFLLNGALVHVLDAGVAGNTSAQILARVTDVVATNVRYCTVLAGANDHNSTTTIANLELIYTALVAAGIEPIPVLMMPNNTDSELPIIATVNAWITTYAEGKGWLVLDAHTPLADPSTGKFKTGLNYDGTHPNQTGHLALGRAFAVQLSGRFGWKPKLTDHSADQLNVGSGGTMVLLSATDSTKAALWGTGFGSGTAPAAAPSLVAATSADGINGNWQRITLSATNNGKYLLRNTTTLASSGVQVGDTLRVGFRLRSSGFEGNADANFYLSIGFTGASGSTQRNPVRNWSADVDGAFVDEFVVPTGTTAIVIEFAAQSTSATTGTATVDLGALTKRNLTRNVLRAPTYATVVNLVTNPRVATNTTGMGYNQGTGTAAASNPSTGGPSVDAPSFYRLTFSVASTTDVQIRNGATGVNLVTVGTSYRFAAAARASWAGAQLRVTVGWYNGASFLSSNSGTTMTPAANEWVTPSVVATAPATADRAQITIYALATGTPAPLGGLLDGTAFMGHISTSGSIAIPYRDGASVDWTWSGTAHASTSSGPALVA